MTHMDLEALEARLRFDLESAGFAPVSGADGEPEGGLLISVYDDHVHISWGMHDRLCEAAIDVETPGRAGEAVVIQYETVRATMHLALGSILNAFGYRTKPHALGFGYIVAPDQP
ncbi:MULTISPECIES: hypothetical protein [unclassified Streptomyces]|uniref:hypothetical protein n=1 Tax=unclassified Streptomyces TaxID=2593676 RepID=UPI00036AE204|nr:MULTISPECIES: hypothetical protein [unclassified Streptomyces]MYY03179.1 hypothetical protein [Streptomyces sp. SID4913]